MPPVLSGRTVCKTLVNLVSVWTRSCNLCTGNVGVLDRDVKDEMVLSAQSDIGWDHPETEQSSSEVGKFEGLITSPVGESFGMLSDHSLSGLALRILLG